jgi:hypothetical protein
LLEVQVRCSGSQVAWLLGPFLSSACFCHSVLLFFWVILFSAVGAWLLLILQKKKKSIHNLRNIKPELLSHYTIKKRDVEQILTHSVLNGLTRLHASEGSGPSNSYISAGAVLYICTVTFFRNKSVLCRLLATVYSSTLPFFCPNPLASRRQSVARCVHRRAPQPPRPAASQRH